jgi:DHA2 family multidrug resistance protein-like MFS transporter
MTTTESARSTTETAGETGPQMTDTGPPTIDVALPKATRREWIGLFVLALGALMYVMDLTVLELAVPKISADLRPTSAELLWIMDIYGFFVAGALITMGALGDRIGRRKLLLIGATAFGATSLLAAFSTTPAMLIVSRAALGIAGATLAPSTLSLIFHMFQDPRERSIAIGVWIGAFSAGSAVGPVVGGVMLEFFWWGSVFLLALPVMAALLILGPRVLPESRDPDAGRLDPASAVMGILAVLAVIFGLKQFAQEGLSPLPIAAVVVGLVVGWAWVRRQTQLADPMVDIRLFRVPAFSAALVVNFVTVFVVVGYFLFVAQYLQLVASLTPFQAGLLSLPSAIAFIVGSQAAPRIVRRIGTANLIGGGLALGSLGLVVLTQVQTTNGLVPLVVASLIISLGLAPTFGLTTELIVGAASPERSGAASGISETGAELGGALGLALLGSLGVVIYRGGLANSLPAGLPTEAAAAARDTLGGAVGVAAGLPAGMADALLVAARSAFVDGMHVAAAIAAMVGFGLAIFALIALRGEGAQLPEAEPVLVGRPSRVLPARPARECF